MIHRRASASGVLETLWGDKLMLTARNLVSTK